MLDFVYYFKLLFKFFFCGIIITIPSFLLSQVPTEQDCLGAIAVCEPYYNQENSYEGTGNYPNEIPQGSGCPGNCMNDGEINDVWYRVTVQSSGLMGFVITPNEYTDDYDWVVYNLTDANCNDIYLNTDELQVSCNWSASDGSTGPNGESNLDCQGSGGTPFNDLIPVNAGETYVINVSNWTSTQSGYTLDFSMSTAQIYDTVAPQISVVNSDQIACGDTTLSFSFSEFVLCNTVTKSNFKLEGPDGEYEIIKINGEACEEGGKVEKGYTAIVYPSFTKTGNYVFSILPASNITDACDNIAIPHDNEFYLEIYRPEIDTSNVIITESTCKGNNGSITGLNVTGSGTVICIWTNESNDTVGYDVDLYDIPEGQYLLTVSDTTLCTSTAGPYKVNNTGGATLEDLFKEDATCELSNGSIIINVSGGAGEVEYSIDNGLNWESGNIFTGLSPGSYNVLVRDTMDCVTEYFNNPVIILNQGEAVEINPSSNSPVCSGDTLILESGVSNANYEWTGPEGFTSDQETALLENATLAASGTYRLIIITEPYNCTDTATLEVEVLKNVPINVTINSTKNMIYPGEEVMFIAECSYSYDAVYEWIINGEVVQKVNDSTYTTSDIKSTSEIKCRVYSEIKCAEPNPSTSNILTVEVLEVKFYLPNSFLPGSTHGNDKFRVYTNSVINPAFTLYIYDRWGKQLFKSDNTEEGWDGTYNGKPMPAGVYVWILTYTFYDPDTGEGQSEKMKGTVFLLR